MPATHDPAAPIQEAARPVPRSRDLAPPQGAPPRPLPTPTVAQLLADPHLGGRGNGPVRQAALVQLQRTQGNRATQRLLQRLAVQRTQGAATAYTPPEAQALHPTFAAHHTPRAQPFNATTAIAVHEARAEEKPNTLIDMTAADGRREIHNYLRDLSEGASQDLVNQPTIQFDTRGQYPCIQTDWIRGGAQVSTPKQSFYLRLRMQWVATGGNGYYQIYHLEALG